VCQAFEAAWQAVCPEQGRPRIEDYLTTVDAAGRGPLLRELVRVELHYRRAERPAPDEYRRRFPEHAHLLGPLCEVRPAAQGRPASAGDGGDTGDSAAESGAGESLGSTGPEAAIRPESPPGVHLSFISPPEGPDELGRLGRYRVLEVLGSGGMGVVYRARHEALDRDVAIKITLPKATLDRFLREARLLAKIKSPYVVTLYDFEILPGGRPMLVMEWVEGTNLHQLIKTRNAPLLEGEVMSLMRDTCEGMLAAADQGIIHRDLKPSNLLIDARGRARVADFGLARGPTLLSEISQSGQMMGTPYYMAPEQAEDPRGVDTRADIYSFGATFYHALTGRPPFAGETAFSILYRHKTEPLISPRALVPDLSERTSELLERCLAKSPADRFTSFAELLRHLGSPAETDSPWDASDDAEARRHLERYRARREVYLQGDFSCRLPDLYSFPQQRVVVIGFGNLAEQQVEALVSSDDHILSMAGGVSAALSAAAGPALRVEAARLVPVRAGRAVVTSAGALPARFVFHGVTIGYRDAQGQQLARPSRDLINDIMASCFYHADSHGVQSIAFPLLGTGTAGLPKDVCLDTTFQFLARTFLHGLTCVREARIVLFDYRISGRT
jgi:serine/threonine protein kinase/O-acetyl-ADP-ribose deacetylase (regulator of RNase III)